MRARAKVRARARARARVRARARARATVVGKVRGTATRAAATRRRQENLSSCTTCIPRTAPCLADVQECSAECLDCQCPECGDSECPPDAEAADEDPETGEAGDEGKFFRISPGSCCRSTGGSQ